jgi:adenosylmethionine---8-amino-7-oxononanoate aminotransferase
MTSSNTFDLVSRDNLHIWHPYQMPTSVEMLAIKSAFGAELFTVDNRVIIDAISSWWVTLLGHCDARITSALQKQLQILHHVMFAGFTHEPAVQLAELLLARLPDNQAKIFFSDNGSTAVEVALKMCIQYWVNSNCPRKKIVALANSYHGDTFGAMSVSSRSIFTKAFDDFLIEVVFIDPLSEDESLNQLENLLKTNEVACYIFEPLVQGASGMTMYSQQFLKDSCKLCYEHGVPTIADEVMTGFGRTGSYFAVDAVDLKPSILCLSKGLTGGTLPLGVTSCSSEIHSKFMSGVKSASFFHGHSYTANPLSCTAGIATLKALQDDLVWEQIESINVSHNTFANQLRNSYLAKRIRQCGTILAFDIENKTQENISTNYLNPLRDTIMQFSLDAGVLLRPLGNVIYLLPPFCINNKQLEKTYSVILELLEFLKS